LCIAADTNNTQNKRTGIQTHYDNGTSKKKMKGLIARGLTFFKRLSSHLNCRCPRDPIPTTIHSNDVLVLSNGNIMDIQVDPPCCGHPLRAQGQPGISPHPTPALDA
jgi:hypothetical protein